MQPVSSALVLVFGLLACGAIAQAAPDFSGQWALAERDGPADASEWMAIHQVIVDKNAFGKPTSPFVQALSVTSTTRGVVRTETIQVGMVGGIVGGQPPQASGQRQPPAVRTLWSVRWHNDRLVMQRGSYGAPGAPGGDVRQERTEEWSLDATGQLVVSIRESGTGIGPSESTHVYRKQ